MTPLPYPRCPRPRRLSAAVLAGALATWAAGPVVSGPASGPPTGPAVPEPWPETLYNPKPLADDLILPLPCGGALAFRPVATPAGHPRTRLVGPFAAGPDGTGERRLLIGKYEVTTLQYQSVMASGAGLACPPVAAAAPSGRRTDPRLLAQAGVSRIDAVNFTAQLSRWLQANAARLPVCEAGARPCLPRVEGRPAFVRLPVDAEWEHAARGGVLVTEADYARPRYPMPEGLDRHAWYNRNAEGELAPIGQRLPNPLGLHDLYGNAWELMNDPYSSEQFPGQVGGDVLRGGGIHSADEDLRADARVEVQPYDSAGDVKTADTGFRVVLAAPVVTAGARRPAAAAAGPVGTGAGSPAAPPPATAAPEVPTDGRLQIEVNVNAILLIDGQMQGVASAGRVLEVAGLTRGRHRVEARAAGDREAAAVVELGSATPVLVRLRLDLTPEQIEARLGLQPRERQRVREQIHWLGYAVVPRSDRFDVDFRNGLRQFQEHEGLPVTGYLNPETRARLEQRLAQRRQPERPLQPPPDGPRMPGGGALLEFPDADTGADDGWLGPGLPGN